MSTKLNEHIEKIEQNIKLILDGTKSSIKIIISNIDRMKIEEYIGNLEKNNSSSNKFNKYKNYTHLIKPQYPFKPEDMPLLRPIYLRLEKYRGRMTSYSYIRSKLDELNKKLTLIKNIINKMSTNIKGYETNLPDPNKIVELLIMCLYLKDNIINKLGDHIGYFYSLEQIGLHIRSLKRFCSSELKDKLDDQFCNTVESLQDIYITQRQFRSLILSMNTQMNYIIAELQLIKLLLEYRDSLKIILDYVERLPFYLKCNVKEFLKDSRSIVQTLTTTSKTIETTISQIKKLKRENPHLSSHIPGELDTVFKSYTSPIPDIIKEASLYLRIVRYIVYNLNIIKSNSTTTVEKIKSKIQQMVNLSSALKQLNEIYNDIIIDYIIL